MKLFTITSIAWVIDTQADYVYNSHESYLISDVIKCYSAGLAAFILIWTPRVHTLIFERYRTIKDDEAENA
jgi:hypothetical protein